VSTFSSTYYVERDGEEIELSVSYSMEPADPSVGIMSAGVTDVEVERDGKPFELTPEEFDDCVLAIAENGEHMDGPEDYE
jgi:hypothetical protein